MVLPRHSSGALVDVGCACRCLMEWQPVDGVIVQIAVQEAHLRSATWGRTTSCSPAVPGAASHPIPGQCTPSASWTMSLLWTRTRCRPTPSSISTRMHRHQRQAEAGAGPGRHLRPQQGGRRSTTRSSTMMWRSNQQRMFARTAKVMGGGGCWCAVRRACLRDVDGRALYIGPQVAVTWKHLTISSRTDSRQIRSYPGENSALPSELR